MVKSNKFKYWLLFSCILECPNSTFFDGIECLSCNFSCLKCEGITENDCFECNEGYFLYNNSCLQDCPLDHPYKDETNKVC